MITIYTRSACVQCLATKRALDKETVTFREINVDQDEGAAQTLRDLGSRTLPVVEVVTGGDRRTWAGYRPELVKQAIEQTKQESPQQVCPAPGEPVSDEVGEALKTQDEDPAEPERGTKEGVDRKKRNSGAH